MKDVAKRANVSIATVSAVVNGTKYVSDELKERVEKAIDELGYRPNRIARSLKGKKTTLIGVIVTEITNPFYPLMVSGIDDAAHEQEYNVLLSTTVGNEEREIEAIETMIDHGVDGIILSTIDRIDSRSLKIVQEENIPTVLINRVPTDYKVSSVCIDSNKVGKIATEHLINSGHQSIAVIGGKRLNSVIRKEAFLKTMQENNLSVRDDWILDVGYKYDNAFGKAYEFLTNCKEANDLPTAIFAATDFMAYGVIKACLKKGLKVPEDISVIGSDNIPFSEDFRVPLTTVDVDTYKMGKEGFD